MFRATFCEHAREPGYVALLDELLQRSDEFRRYWVEHEVTQLDDARPLIVAHPVYGELRFVFRAVPVANGSSGRICFLVPDTATLERPAYAQLLRSLY